MSETIQQCTVGVLGLGPMGVKIAQVVAATGHHVTVWNRTPRTLAELGLDGEPRIDLADSPEAAATTARIVVICVRDHEASRELVGRIASRLDDAVVLNVSTGTPSQAVESASQAAAAGVRYVTGAVMVPTPLVGSDDCLVLYAGEVANIHRAAPFMAAMGGSSDVVGEDHSVPPALDLAMLDLYFAGMYAYLHSAVLARAHGIDPSRYLTYAETIVDTLRSTLPGLTSAIQARTYDGGEARLDMCLAFLDHIVRASIDVGLDPGVAEVVRDASVRAMTRWPGSTDWDVVAEDLATDAVGNASSDASCDQDHRSSAA